MRCKTIIDSPGFTWVQCYQCHPECEIWFPYCIHDWDEEMQAKEREYHLQEDLLTEDELARAYIYGESDVPWPWYADAPCIVLEPEVFSS